MHAGPLEHCLAALRHIVLLHWSVDVCGQADDLDIETVTYNFCKSVDFAQNYPVTHNDKTNHLL